MNKREFLQILETQLRGLPQEEIREIIGDYDEHFDIGLSEGRSEENIASSLGNPKIIAKEIRANFLVNQANESFTVNNFFQALIATIGLGFFNLIFVLGPFLGILGAIVGLGVGGIAIALSGLAVLISGIIGVNHFWVTFFLGIAITSFGLILTLLVYEGGRWFLRLTIRYLQWNVNIITRRRGQHENV